MFLLISRNQHHAGHLVEVRLQHFLAETPVAAQVRWIFETYNCTMWSHNYTFKLMSKIWKVSQLNRGKTKFVSAAQVALCAYLGNYMFQHSFTIRMKQRKNKTIPTNFDHKVTKTSQTKAKAFSMRTKERSFFRLRSLWSLLIVLIIISWW